MNNYFVSQTKNKKYTIFKCKHCNYEFKFSLKELQNIGVYFTLTNHTKDNHYIK